MQSFVNISLAQINPEVGNLRYNLSKIKEFWYSADRSSHMVVFPEMSLCGYTPEDLLLRLDFIRACHGALEELLDFSKSLSSVAVIGMPYYEKDLYNALVLLAHGQIWGVYRKTFLPNYSVFDEKRYFKAGSEGLVAQMNGAKFGFSVCEDMWHPDGWEREYALEGCEVLININASPYYAGKYQFKENFLKARAEDNIAYVVYVNLVGAQDELVFDGRSVVINPEGKVLARAKAFEEDLLTVSLDLNVVRRRRLLDLRLREKQIKKSVFVSLPQIQKNSKAKGRIESSLQTEEELYRALTLSIRDYAKKNRFEKAVVGLSGGIDSSLVACLAVDALREENVVGVFMPSEFTSRESYEAVQELSKNLRIELLTYPITSVYKAYLQALSSQELTVAEENLQSRIRANLLFYLSNRHGWLVLSTSNKSESAVGYTTIYGDMSGGFAPIKDLYKTQVYKVARYRNSIKEDIPERVLTRPPTAELRPNQTDQDSLPPYPVLDKILELYLEEGLSFEELLEEGFEPEVVKKVIKMVKFAEYKRKQAPPGPKLTKRALGKDWRMPVSNAYLGV